MTDVEVFQFPATGGSVRTIVIDGEPQFVAADVCSVLGYGGGARNAVSRLPERMRGVATINTPGGPQSVTVLNEAGVYRLTMRSSLPSAEAFQDWLAEEVVPTVRRTGGYAVAHRLPQTYTEALRELLSTVERKEQIERELEAAAPRAEAWDVLASAHGDYSVREASFILNRDPAIDTGQTRLFKLLREWKLIDSTDKPYAAHSAHVRLRAWSSPHPQTGEEIARKPQVRITHEGLKYLHRRLGGTEPLAA